MDILQVRRVLSLHAKEWTVEAIAKIEHLEMIDVLHIVSTESGVRELPPEPTSHPAGTRDKVAVLRERAEKGYELWHPADKSDFSGVKNCLFGTGLPGVARSKGLK